MLYLDTFLLQSKYLNSGPPKTKQTNSFRAEIAIWAASFGAEIHDQVTKRTTHVVAARKGTNKIHEARRKRRIKIVTTHWLHDSLMRFERMREDDYLLLAPEEKTHAVGENSTQVIFDEHNDVSSTEESAMELAEEDLGTELDEDDGTEDLVSEATDNDSKPIEISDATWQDMDDDFKEFMGSDMDDSDAEDSDANTNNDEDDAEPDSSPDKKRKRDLNSATNSDAEDSDASTKSTLGSKLQRRKKRAYERTTSLTNAITVDEVGLPSPLETAVDDKERNGVATAKELPDVQEDADGDEGDDDGFDEAFREALEGSE